MKKCTFFNTKIYILTKDIAMHIDPASVCTDYTVFLVGSVSCSHLYECLVLHLTEQPEDLDHALALSISPTLTLCLVCSSSSVNV